MSAVQTEQQGEVVVVRFRQRELRDQVLARQVGEELKAAADQARDGKMVVDFSGVEQLCSTMIGQLLLLRNTCRAKDIDLKLCGLTAEIVELLEILQLSGLFHICTTVEQAKQAMEEDFEVDNGLDEQALAQQCRTAAENGDPVAQYEMGRRCDEGLGVDQNPAEAFRWYQQAAEQGHVEALFMVGNSHAYGIHVEQSYEEAVKWYRRAAERGHADAQYLVGMAYEYGVAGVEDLREAARWYEQAARQGHRAAQVALQRVQEN